jgi:hypothetical protein
MRDHGSVRRAAVAATVLSSLLLAACAPVAPALPPVQTSLPPATLAPAPTPTLASPTAALAAAFTVGPLVLVTAPQDVVPGSTVVLKATVQNVGPLAGTYVAELTSGGLPVQQQEARLEPGQTTDLLFQVIAGSAGRYDLQLGPARHAHDVLGPAAFEVTAPTMTPAPAEVGDKVSVAVIVKNNGGLEGELLVQLAVDGTATAKQTVTVAGGASTDVTFSVPVAKPGKHVVSVNGQDAELVVWKIERPVNGKVFSNKLKGGHGQLTVDNGDPRDALMVLTAASDPKTTLLSFYVRGGTTRAVTGIKDGTYIVYFRLGQRWDSHSRRFTSEVSSSRFKETLPFKTTSTTYAGWKLSLKPVAGGNAPTEGVGDEDFPEVEEE